MPGDGGHLEGMWLLPFAAAMCHRDHSLVSGKYAGDIRDRASEGPVLAWLQAAKFPAASLRVC
jgi:hypothetical protein